MIPLFLRKNGGLPDMGQTAVCVFSYAVSFLSPAQPVHFLHLARLSSVRPAV